MTASPQPLREVLLAPGVPWTLGSSLVGRLPYAVIGLLLLLRVRQIGGGYAEGGLVAGAFSVSVAFGAPLIGRLVDARGQSAVLAATGLGSSSALVAIGLAPASTPLGILAALAALTGLLHPPLGGCLRALWPVLVPHPDRRHAAYALEASALESTFVLGPLLLVGGLATVAGPGPALLAAAGLLLAGTLAFAASPPARTWRPAGRVSTGLLGALRSSGLRVLFVVAAGMGASFGAIEVATTAFAEEQARRSLVGPLLACWALGSLAGGVVAARRGAPADPAAHLLKLLVLLAVADLALAAAPNPWALAGLLCVAGLWIAPAFATVYGVVAAVARPGTLIESFTWLATGISAGAAAGAAVAGGLVELHSPRAGLALAGALVLAGVVAAVTNRHRLVTAG